MAATRKNDHDAVITVRPVDRDNWRAVVALQVGVLQHAFAHFNAENHDDQLPLIRS